MLTISVARTGDSFSMDSCEFLITWPDGTTETLWSPPWHEMSDEDEESGAFSAACAMWLEKHPAPPIHKDGSLQMAGG